MSPQRNQNHKITGLVLTGGGARASYQAGVLQGISEIIPERSTPFQVITGVSAGAINGGFLAGTPLAYSEATRGLCDLWKSLEIDQVFKTGVGAFSRIGAKWIRDLSFGGMLGPSGSNHLLDASPLKKYLESKIQFQNIKANIASQKLRGVAVSATNYFTGTAVSFFDGDPEISEWVRSWRIGMRSEIGLQHILASCAIPVLFEPVPVEGVFFGDGGVRLTAPVSPAIHLGADRVLAVGIRYLRSNEQTIEINRHGKMDRVSIADIAGILMNAAFLDSLDTDIERMTRINQTIAVLPPERRAMQSQNLKEIPILVIRPSKDLGRMASDQFSKFPRTLRYFLAGLGASGEKGWDFLSYLAFDPAYVGELIDLGRSDALAMKSQIETFFE